MINIINDNIILYNDDAKLLVKKLIDNNIIVNHVITDPPYNISQKSNFSTMNRFGLDFGEWDKDFDLYDWIADYAKIIDKNGSFIIFCSYRALSYIIDRLESYNFIVKDIIKWIKNNPMPRNIDRRYVQDTEFAIWAVRKSAKWTFNRPQEKGYLRPEFRFPIVGGKEKIAHPTQKSLDLMKEIIKIHTNANDVIIDPFMGSGTTGVACFELNRKFIGVEKEKNYYEQAKNRILFFDNKNI